MATIALLEPDAATRRKLSAILAGLGHRVHAAAAHGGRFLDIIVRHHPRLVLLDLNGGGISGWDLLRTIRQTPWMRQLLVVAVGDSLGPEEIVRAFDAGADECLSKPLDYSVLCASVEALLRRDAWQSEALAPQPAVHIGPLDVDETQHLAFLDHKPLKLRPMEFKLLLYFVNHTERLLTASLLLDQVWKKGAIQLTRTVATTVESLRRKLDGALRIETVYGQGYRVSAKTLNERKARQRSTGSPVR